MRGAQHLPCESPVGSLLDIAGVGCKTLSGRATGSTGLTGEGEAHVRTRLSQDMQDIGNNYAPPPTFFTAANIWSCQTQGCETVLLERPSLPTAQLNYLGR